MNKTFSAHEMIYINSTLIVIYQVLDYQIFALIPEFSKILKGPFISDNLDLISAPN
jgi:hypothetical protein